MKNKLWISSVVATLLVTTTLFASSAFIPNLNDELSYNKTMLKEYKERIKKLEQRNSYLEKIKKENPKLYVNKPLYEETKESYIYRIKLDGAEAKNMQMTVKNHTVALEMNLKTQRNDKNGFFMSTREFYQQFTIPKNVKESKITNRVDGDYFEIVMPKDKS